jgi:hypothetical protein
MKDINEVLALKLDEIRRCKVEIYCLKVVIPLLADAPPPSKNQNVIAE